VQAGEGAVQEATELINASLLRFVGNAEGKDRSPPGRRGCARRPVGNVTIKFFEGLSSFIFDMLRSEFDASRWACWPLFMRPGPNRIRRRFDYERLGGIAARRQGHGADHPWPGAATDDRLRGRSWGGGGAGADPRTDR
jgi:fatty acid/phospholipid biosynthesis enzyme